MGSGVRAAASQAGKTRSAKVARAEVRRHRPGWNVGAGRAAPGWRSLPSLAGPAAADLAQRLRTCQVAESIATNWPQQEAGGRSALCSRTVAWNSERENNCKIWLKMLDIGIHGDGDPTVGLCFSTQTVAELYRRGSKANLDKNEFDQAVHNRARFASSGPICGGVEGRASASILRNLDIRIPFNLRQIGHCHTEMFINY